MKLRAIAWLPWLLALGSGCQPDNPSTDETGTTDATGGSNVGPGGELLGCPPGGCTMVLAVQTLDDRVEVFVPEHPDSTYRGAISLDLEPNECGGCGLGDNNDGRLDEPFGIVRTGTFLHVLTGHYPTRMEGSLVSFPLTFFDGTLTESTVAVSDYFAGGQFQAPVTGRSLMQIEPIFMHAHASGRLLVGVFNNDLFAGEDTWTQTGRILVIDPQNPAGEVGEARLQSLDGGPCQGASQVITLSNDVVAVACDGNEAVAVLNATNLDDGTPMEAAGVLEEGFLCPIPGAMPGKRVRYLAPDGNGGFAVLEGPTPTDPNASARLWHMGVDCSLQGGGPLELSTMLGGAGDWQMGELARLPAGEPTWIIAAGSSNPNGLRGLFVAENDDGVLELCPEPIPGFEEAWQTPGGAIEPFSVAVTSDAVHLAVGAGPYIADPAGVGYGKVLWATLAGTAPCSLTATVTDLTDGGPGHAPAPAPTEPSTFRRGPNVVVIQEIGP